MANKKYTTKPKSRNSISDPNYNESYTDLLRKAEVQKFKGKFKVQTLENGRVIVEIDTKN